MKKKIYVLLSCLVQIFILSQTGGDNIQVQGNNVFSIGKRATKEKHIDGSKYFNGNDFEKVSILGYSKNVQNLRYDAYNDEMEYNANGNNYYIDKIPDQVIHFIDLNKIYVCFKYKYLGKDYFGYLYQIIDNKDKYSLYKKERIEKLDGEKSLNGIVGERNDYYVKDKDIYLISKNNQLSKFPKNVNDASEFFSIDKKELENFTKSNKINFNKELDLLKLVEFVNQH
jgi:hypothetical protein